MALDYFLDVFIISLCSTFGKVHDGTKITVESDCFLFRLVAKRDVTLDSVSWRLFRPLLEKVLNCNAGLMLGHHSQGSHRRLGSFAVLRDQDFF